MRSQEEIKNLLKAGNKQQALALLVEALKADPNDVDAWWLLSFAVAERDKQVYAVRRVLRLSPGNPKAAARLAKLESRTAEAPAMTFQMPASGTLANRSSRTLAFGLGAAFIATIAVAVLLTFTLRTNAAPARAENQMSVAGILPSAAPSDTPAQELAVLSPTDAQASPATEPAAPTPTSEPLPTSEPVTITDETTVSLVSNETPNELPLPVFDQFVQSVVNGEPDQRVGVFVENLFSFPIIQQPANQPAYITSSAGEVTEFRIVRQQTGNEGLIAHNYLAGNQFFSLKPGDIAEIVLGDGSVIEFEIVAVEDYQALTPNSPTSDFLDLATGAKLSASDLFYRVYGGNLTLTFQTCINRNNLSTWGRTFIIGEEL